MAWSKFELVNTKTFSSSSISAQAKPINKQNNNDLQLQIPQLWYTIGDKQFIWLSPGGRNKKKIEIYSWKFRTGRQF